MNVKISLILKVLNKDWQIIGENGALPSFYLSGDELIRVQIHNFLQKYDLVYDWLDVKHVMNEVVDGELVIFYSAFVPKEFVNNDIKYIEKTGNLSNKDEWAIQKSVRICAY